MAAYGRALVAGRINHELLTIKTNSHGKYQKGIFKRRNYDYLAACALPACGHLCKNAAAGLQPAGKTVDKNRKCLYTAVNGAGGLLSVGRIKLQAERKVIPALFGIKNIKDARLSVL
jgi:hypothetical protein